MPDLDAAGRFIHDNGRLVERRRFEHLFGTPDPDGVRAAVKAYVNPDGGIGAMEPDLRTPASQPSAVLYALEALEGVDGGDPAITTPALDWIATIAGEDGGIPFVLLSAAEHSHAPWWAPSEDPPSSLLMTAGVAQAALRLGLDHPWLANASDYVWTAMAGLQLSDPYSFRYVVHFLDVAGDRERAEAEIARLAERMPEDGILKVEAGVDGETLSAVEVATHPGHVGARLFPAELIDRQLGELAAEQHEDGGWDFTWPKWNPAAAYEWRGVVTLQALTTLRAHGRL
jgi:hypothetical protein